MSEERYIYRLFTAQHAVKKVVVAQMKKAGIKITIAQAGILFLLENSEGRKMSELSTRLKIDNSTITGLVDRLEKLDMVRRQPDAQDRRSMIIVMTPEGLEEIRRAKVIVTSINRQIAAIVSERKQSPFIEQLIAIARHFDPSD